MRAAYIRRYHLNYGSSAALATLGKKHTMKRRRALGLASHNPKTTRVPEVVPWLSLVIPFTHQVTTLTTGPVRGRSVEQLCF